MNAQLPLEPAKPLPLQEAYDRSGLRAKYTFQQAMSRPLIALCLRNTAEAIAKKRNQA